MWGQPLTIQFQSSDASLFPPTPTTTSQPGPAAPPGLSGGAISGVAIGALVGVVTLTTLGFFLVRRLRRRTMGGGTEKRAQVPLELATTTTNGKHDVLEAGYALTRLVGGEKPAGQSPRELMGPELGEGWGRQEMSG